MLDLNQEQINSKLNFDFYNLYMCLFLYFTMRMTNNWVHGGEISFNVKHRELKWPKDLIVLSFFVILFFSKKSFFKKLFHNSNQKKKKRKEKKKRISYKNRQNWIFVLWYCYFRFKCLVTPIKRYVNTPTSSPF